MPAEARSVPVGGSVARVSAAVGVAVTERGSVAVWPVTEMDAVVVAIGSVCVGGEYGGY